MTPSSPRARASGRPGFSLVEAILYVGLTAVLLVTVVQLMLRLIDARDRQTRATEVTQNVRHALGRMEAAVRAGSHITSASAGELVIGSGAVTSYQRFFLQDDAVVLGDAAGEHRLTSPAVRIESLVFADRTGTRGPAAVDIILRASPVTGSGGGVSLSTTVSTRSE